MSDKLVKALRDFAKRGIDRAAYMRTHPDDPCDDFQSPEDCAIWFLACISGAATSPVWDIDEREPDDVALNGEPLVLIQTQNDPWWIAASAVNEHDIRIDPATRKPYPVQPTPEAQKRLDDQNAAIARWKGREA